MPPLADPFPSSEFDDWAASYDRSISDGHIFPFAGYGDLLKAVVALAEPSPGMSVLDLGTGTGNLAVQFENHGCVLWCTDFSAPMLEKAKSKLPRAHFVLHDLRDLIRQDGPDSWPAELKYPFDRIVSAYVFHHFELEEKVRLVRSLLPCLARGGRIVLGDIAFPDQAALDRVKAEVGDVWEDEFYWLADKAVPTLRKAGMKTLYRQVSSCAGVFVISLLTSEQPQAELLTSP